MDKTFVLITKNKIERKEDKQRGMVNGKIKTIKYENNKNR